MKVGINKLMFNFFAYVINGVLTILFNNYFPLSGMSHLKYKKARLDDYHASVYGVYSIPNADTFY